MTTFDLETTQFTSFQQWTRSVRQVGLDPLVYVAGTRGKSTIVRLLDAMAKAEGLRTAIRTDAGVEIEGRRQLGDMLPLRESLDEMDAGELDLVIVEMDWGDIERSRSTGAIRPPWFSPQSVRIGISVCSKKQGGRFAACRGY